MVKNTIVRGKNQMMKSNEMDFDTVALMWMPSTPRRYIFDLWLPESNQVILSVCKFHWDCSSRSWDIMV